MESDRLKRALERFISRTLALPTVDFRAHYPSKVIGQNADGSLELQPDDTRLPTLSRVPLRLGIPGVTVKIAAGSRVLLFFEGGQPDGQAAALFQASTLQEITITANAKVTVNAPEIDLADASGAVLRSGDTVAITGLNAPPGGGTVTGPLVLGTITSPSKVKA